MLWIIQPDDSNDSRKLSGMSIYLSCSCSSFGQATMKHKPPGNEPEHNRPTSDSKLLCFVPMGAECEARTLVCVMCDCFGVSTSLSKV